jgi:uncharacterized membrane protein YbhN (UPF0104 family)
MFRVSLHQAGFALRLLLSALLLAAAIRTLDWGAVIHTSETIRVVWLLLAVLCILLANIIAGMRWSLILLPTASLKTYLHLIGLYMAGGLINQGLPSTLGGDSFRVIRTSSPGLRWPAVLAVFMDRGLGVVGNIFFGVFGLLISKNFLFANASQLGLNCILALLALLVAIGLFLHFRSGILLIDSLCLRLKLPPSGNALKRVIGWPMGLFQIPLSIVIHALNFCALLCCFYALSLAPPTPIVICYLSLLGFILVLPVSISGWGIREVTLSAALAPWGIDPSVTILASIFFGIATLLALLPGLFWLVTPALRPEFARNT